MTLRTVVRDGLIVINTHGAIPDGTPVEVVRTPPANGKPRKRTRSAAAKKARPSPTRKAKKSGDAVEGLIGIWKDRPDWKGKTTLQIAAELRNKALGRAPR